jgi:hypothetical protein
MSESQAPATPQGMVPRDSRNWLITTGVYADGTFGLAAQIRVGIRGESSLRTLLRKLILERMREGTVDPVTMELSHADLQEAILREVMLVLDNVDMWESDLLEFEPVVVAAAEFTRTSGPLIEYEDDFCSDPDYDWSQHYTGEDDEPYWDDDPGEDDPDDDDDDDDPEDDREDRARD